MISFCRMACILVSILFSLELRAQLVSGPMLGPVELRTAKLWIEVKPGSRVTLQYWKQGEIKFFKTMDKRTNIEDWFSPLLFDLVGLDVHTTYEYRFAINQKAVMPPTKADGSFTTKELWQWRKPAPDFSFLTGSCSYVNEPAIDRPGKPYGGDSSIFESMAKEKAAFMLWLGDSWYTREVDYFDEWGLWNRASHDRAAPVLQKFLKSTSHFAMWDDHDYGPNDIGTNYILKETSRNVFKNYWLNTTYGMNNKGIYSMISYADVDIFMMDDRWWRSADAMKDSIDGKPNPDKIMWGKEQMDWLKNALLYSRAPFKIIATGSQVLNPVSPFDKLLNCPAEYNELMHFLKENNINGVLFLTGDRHHSEIIKADREGTYPLYDITASPLTAGTHAFSGPEKNNPYRIFGLDQKQNYAKFSFSGERNQRKLTVEFFGVAGDKLGEWKIGEKELTTPKK
ncbi:MAG: alkaline phosphatase family protein [Chitinophagaceae bacterium]|jgi:alkaline phosphatase D|nr:alkaline phosphatase family protein [Chitinophagaceae bacterium]